MPDASLPPSSPGDEPRLLVSTFPSPEKAAEIARILVDERLCACVSLVPGIRSIYRWEGAVTEDTETLALIKTTASRYDELARRLVSLHPYDVPELITLPVVGGHAPYLAWLLASTQSGAQTI